MTIKSGLIHLDRHRLCMGLLDYFRRGLTPDRFARLLMDRIKAAGDGRPVRYDAENFCLTSADRGAITNLHNLYAEYERADKDDREKVVRNFLAAWFTTEMELPATLDDAKPDLLVSLRSRSYYEVGVALMSENLEPNDQLPYAEIAGCLAVSPIYDLPTSIRSLSHSDLEQWGVTLYEALEIAKQNLRELTSEVAQAGELFLFASGDSHDAARLVLTDLIAELGVDGQPIAMAPNREMLLVTGSENEEGLRHMAAIAAEGLQHERGISGMALALDGDEWSPWLPPPGHLLAKEFALLRAQTIGGDYAQQKLLLDKRSERDGQDVFVASYSAVQGDDDQVITYSVWADGVETLLPRSDYVVLMSAPVDGEPPKTVAAADWDTVHRLAGDLMKPIDSYPPRVRVDAFPTEDQISEIGLAPWAEI